VTVLHESTHASELPDRLRQRLESLGVTVALVTLDGSMAVQGPAQWIEQVIIGSPQFTTTVRQHLSSLQEHPGCELEAWPGVWLVPLPGERQRRIGPHDKARPLAVALMLSPALFDSEWLHVLCDTQKLDYQATVERIDQEHLVSTQEIHRLASVVAWMHADTIAVDRRTSELKIMSQQLGNSYEELSLLYKLSSGMMVNRSHTQFLNEACHDLQQTVGLRWLTLCLIDDEPRLNELAGQCYTAGSIDCDQQLLKRIGSILILQSQHHSDEVRTLVIDDTQTLGVPHLPRLAQQLLVVMLVRKGRPFGILFGGDKIDGSHISSEDSKLCSSLANSLSIFLQNMMLYDDMEAMFIGTLHALTSSIDAKDSYTYGHSERVAMMAGQLAVAVGLDDHTVERVRLSALVHDVGKIGVPEAILCKPGPLTDKEYAIVKQHPEIGAKILADIRLMHDLIPGVLYHHERWDGNGYPHGLAGEDIPLLGRLICLADSFDAMSSNRTYRLSMNLEQALSELQRCAGTQYDPALVQAFIDLDFSPFFDLIQQHQNQQVSQCA